MFHLDITIEDTRMIANNPDGMQNYKTLFTDGLTGEQKEVELTATQLAYTIAIILDKAGTPPNMDEMYKELEPIYKDFPPELRPIP